MGTVGYMSPEQVRGLSVDHRSDIFSFGAILYEMLSGRPAFRRDTAAESLTAILKEEPPELSGDGSVSPTLDRIVRRCLEKNPDERFQSADDLAFDLEFLVGDVPSGPSTGKERRPGAPALRWIVLAVALLGLPVAALVGRRMALPPQPLFHRLTFSRGTVYSARFTHDAETVVYGAAWEGQPCQLYSVRALSPDSTAPWLANANVLANSSSGETAVQLGSRFHLDGWFEMKGTLARAPLFGTPREVREDVLWADWLPDGSGFAVARDEKGRTQLEFPIGRVVYETGGWVSHLRVSPQGDQVAFLDHPVRSEPGGAVVVVSREGKKKTLSDGWASAQGLAWRPDGREIWFTAVRNGLSWALLAVDLSGHDRLIYRSPKPLRVHDIARDGRILITQEDVRRGVFGLAPGGASERELSFLDSTVPMDLTTDGTRFLFDETPDAGGLNPTLYIRGTDGSPPVRLGEGGAVAISPDGNWALSLLLHPGQLVLVPAKAGESRPLPRDALDYQFTGAFLPDGKGVVYMANEKGSAPKLYFQDLAGGKPRAFSPEGMSPGPVPVSPDGKLVAARGADRKLHLYPVDGGEVRSVPGAEDGDWPSRFAADGRSLFVYRRGEIPCRLFRLDLATERRTIVKELKPADAAGTIAIPRVLVTPDARAYVYSVFSVLSDLYLAEGLR
jgi:hypothetical protein